MKVTGVVRSNNNQLRLAKKVKTPFFELRMSSLIENENCLVLVPGAYKSDEVAKAIALLEKARTHELQIVNTFFKASMNN